MNDLPQRQVTLCLLLKKDGDQVRELCLAMKKQGFGAGRWNGVGGKVKPGETIEQAMVRETKEEIGVTVTEYYPTATLHFYFPHQPDWNQTMHVYLATAWQGTPTESEEMKPAWFLVAAIPYPKMWPSDVYWLPSVLKGQPLVGSITFGKNDKILQTSINFVESYAPNNFGR